MRSRAQALIAVALVVSVAACSSASAATEDVNVEEFASVIEGPGIVILDVRTPEEFAQGHIAGSININVESPDFTSKLEQLDKSQTYAVYCRSGRRSGVATQQMESLGFTSLYNMNGGVIDWAGAGFELVTP